MRKKILTAMLMSTMAATILAGCGASAQTNNNVIEANEMSQESESSEVAENIVEPTAEPTATPEVIESVESTEGSEATESTESSESAESTEGSESVEGSEATEGSEGTTGEQTGVVEVAKPSEEPKPTEEPKVEETKVQYTYTDVSRTMYAKQSVNVRDLPSTDGNKVTSLKSGQAVVVTGQCNETGWYRLDNGYFVSNKYLSESAPVVATPAPEPTTVEGTEVIATPIEGTQTSQQADSTVREAELATDFLGILNAKRAAEGLSQVSWGSDLDNTALTSAEAISSNFSHSALTGHPGVENIAMGQSSSQQVFDSWYESDGHRVAMMASDLETISCARYGNYWVFVGKCKPVTIESVQEQIDSGEMEHVSSTDVGNGQTVDVYITEGADATEDYTQEELDNMFSQWEDQWEEQLKQMGY